MSSKDRKNAANNESITEKEKKSVRHRKKKFYNEIRQQMEFYFGDANLAKDRFTRELIQKDPCKFFYFKIIILNLEKSFLDIPLSVFLSFNKIKKLTTSEEVLAKSIESSSLLKLSEDRSKVCRITEIQENRDVDEKTLYVEALPAKADHDWIKSSFSRFGPISYVSLPRYKVSKKIKEFAFIEFEKEESIGKTMKFFKEFGGCLCLDSNPSELMSVTTFIKEQKNEDSKEDQDKNDEPPVKKAKLEESEGSSEGESETDGKDDNEEGWLNILLNNNIYEIRFQRKMVKRNQGNVARKRSPQPMMENSRSSESFLRKNGRSLETNT